MVAPFRGLLRGFRDDLLRTQDQITPAERPRAYRLFVLDAGLWSGMNALQSGPFVAAFALAIGATNYEIGLIASMTFFGMMMQFPGIFLVQRFPRRRAIGVLLASTCRLLWIPVILIPFLFVDRGITFMLQFLFLSALIGGMAVPSWHSFMKDGIAPDDMPQVLSRRNVWAVIAALIATLAGGVFVDLWKAWAPDAPLYGYSILFFIAMLLGMGGVVAIYFLPEPRARIARDAKALDLLLRPFRDPHFVKLLKFAAPWTFAVQLSLPFFLVYLYKRLELSVSMVTLLVAVSQLSHIFFARVWSRLVQRFSSKSVLSVTYWVFLASLLLWPFLMLPEKHALTLPLAFLIYFLNGMAMSGIQLAAMTVSLKLSPAGQAHSYMTAYFSTLGFAAAVAPMLGGTLSNFLEARDISFSFARLGLPALNLREFDFLFLLSFAVGLFALYRLGRFREKGEVGERKVIEGLMGRLSASFRIATSPGTYRRLTLYLLYPFR